MTLKTEFFLGANSAEGFYSLYDQLREGERMRDLIVLKGGPGVGKSTFMRCIANQAEEKGLQIEYIRCSGDPDSLDAVWLPQLGTAVVDGTAPHVVEPAYPAAVGRYVNLGQFYNVDRLKERRREIVACTNGYQAEYRKAYACLHACGAVRAEMEGSAGAGFDYEKLRRRLKNIWQRERGKKRGGIGREQHRFLGGLTPAGRWWCTDSLFALCGRIYDLQDSYHLTAAALEELRGIVCADGFDVLLCLDPDCPARIAFADSAAEPSLCDYRSYLCAAGKIGAARSSGGYDGSGTPADAAGWTAAETALGRSPGRRGGRAFALGWGKTQRAGAHLSSFRGL